MERTKSPKSEKPLTGSNIQTMSILMERAKYASQLGLQYGGDRKIYEALGYPKYINYADYMAKYSRQDMATAIIDRPVNAT